MMQFTVSFLSLHYLHLQFCCLLTIFVLIGLYAIILCYNLEIYFLFWSFLSLAISRSSRVQSRRFVAYNVNRLFFLSIFCLFFGFPVCPLIAIPVTACFVFFCSFLCIPRVFVLMHLRSPQCCWVFFLHFLLLFLLLLHFFLTYRICLCHLSNVINFFVFWSICFVFLSNSLLLLLLFVVVVVVVLL